ncbi:MAG: glycosyltransferase family 39 protein [Gemmataceae bacterium]|nr:glycosyltransferase family 39 protein [Gemmataceae bacterium]
MKRSDLPACLFLALVAALAGCARAHWPSAGHRHDDGVYLGTARALAEGRGYVLGDLPGTPPQTKYPPLYPALLAGLWKLDPAFPDNLPLLKSFTLLCAAAFVALSHLFLVRFGYLSRAASFGACLLAATAPYFADYATALTSEMLFGLLCLALLWRLDALRETPRPSFASDALTGLLLGLPFLCRSIGGVFLPLGVLFLRGHGRSWVRPSIIAALLIAPWIAWTRTSAFAQQADPIEGYYTDYLGWYVSFGPPALARVVGLNAVMLSANVARRPLEGVGTLLRQVGPAAEAVPMLFVGMIGLAALGERARRGEALPLILLGYLLVVLVWPWEPSRFLLPFLPAIAGFVLAGLWQIAAPRLGETRTRLAGVLVVAVGVLGNSIDLGLRCWHVHAHSCPTGDDGKECGTWTDAREVIDWLEAHAAPDDLIASGSDALLGLHTRRKAFYPIICSPLSYIYGMEADAPFDASLAGLRRHQPRWLATTAGVHGEKEFDAWVARLRAAFPANVKRVFAGTDPRFAVYEISYPLPEAKP